MAKLKLYEYPHPILHQKAERVLKVDDEIRKLLDDMLETMYADKGVLAKLRGFLSSCGKVFSEMERGAGRLAEKAGGEKSSVKTELAALKATPSGQHRADPGKDKAR